MSEYNDIIKMILKNLGFLGFAVFGFYILPLIALLPDTSRMRHVWSRVLTRLLGVRLAELAGSQPA
jgi:hypothetical protein